MSMLEADKLLIQRFSDSQLIERGLSTHTISAYATDLRAFVGSLETPPGKKIIVSGVLPGATQKRHHAVSVHARQ